MTIAAAVLPLNYLTLVILAFFWPTAYMADSQSVVSFSLNPIKFVYNLRS